MSNRFVTRNSDQPDLPASRRAPQGAPCSRARQYLFDADRVIGVVLGAVLLTAGAMKARQAAADAAVPAALNSTLWVPAPILILAECALGVWLLSGIRREESRLAALGCFALFAGVSLSSAVAGEPSCGCFGAAAISPKATAALDLAAIAALLCARQGRRNIGRARQPLTASTEGAA